MPSKTKDPHTCAFCGRSAAQVNRLISSSISPTYICDDCVSVCMEILEEDWEKAPQKKGKKSAPLSLKNLKRLKCPGMKNP